MEKLAATSDLPTNLDALVLSALLATDQATRIHHAPWQRSKLNSSARASCAYCSKDLANAASREAMLSYLVPVHLGGPPIEANRVLACATCALTKFHHDLVAWPRLQEIPEANREALLAKRKAMLVMAHNHLTPHYRRSLKRLVVSHLENRFEHPRFRVFAVASGDEAWIGWRAKGKQSEMEQVAGILRWSYGAQPISEGNLVCFKLPACKFLEAIWQLIEHHGLVIPLDIPNIPAGNLEASDWRNCWTRRFQKVNDLCRRHSRRYQEVAPSPPRELSQKPGPVSKRKCLAKQKLAREAKREELRIANLWREYEQAYESYRELVRVRKLQDPPLIPIQYMADRSRHCMELKARALGIELKQWKFT